MRIGILGANGRMGRMLLAEVLARPEAVLAGAAVRAGEAEEGFDAGLLAGRAACGVACTSHLDAVFAGAEAVIDFTHPSVLADHATRAARHGAALIVGTTGYDAEGEAALLRAAQQVPIVAAPNMSVGVVLLTALVEQVASRLGIEFDIEIAEMHHRHKIDAPSGTALALGRAAAAGRGVALDAVAVRSRDGQTGARPEGTIGFATLRGGDVVGDHTVCFAGEGERLELTHKASSRRIFAAGAVRAALWSEGQEPGLYSMRDVLGL